MVTPSYKDGGMNAVGASVRSRAVIVEPAAQPRLDRLVPAMHAGEARVHRNYPNFTKTQTGIQLTQNSQILRLCPINSDIFRR